MDLSLWLDSPISEHPDMKACPPTQPSFQFHLEERLGMDVQTVVISQERLKIEVKFLLSGNRNGNGLLHIAPQCWIVREKH